MNLNTDLQSAETLPIKLEDLSKGVDRILERWTGENRPTKLTLLNDLAAAISPGSNWGALKAKQFKRAHPQTGQNTSFIPAINRSAKEFPARLAEVKNSGNGIDLAHLVDEIRPLFAMRHAGNPIVGLELSVVEGNGYSEASIYAKLILNRGDTICIAEAYASDLEPVVAQIVYNAIQNLNSIELYPTLAQNACSALRIVVGPFDCVLSIPEFYGRTPDESHASQGVRVLLDEGDTPSVTDLDLALRLLSAVAPHLGQKQFAEHGSVRFRLSQPLMQVWKPIGFTAPDLLDDRPMFWIPDGEYWAHEGDHYLLDHNIWTHSTLGEPLDLALALINIDDPDVYLKVALTPMPKRSQRSGQRQGNSRGGFHRDFQVLRIRAGQPTQELRLDAETNKRFEAGFLGWAMHEGHEVIDDRTLARTEALIPRNLRRASQHLLQVEAIMNGVDPRDKELLRGFRA
ncbi:hypothetical protein [Phaeobacter gallaeciensis]|uniref:hypothetical protein n=1 Tax=Phaeobacter gallaeciensis TaxID=60890 RepID=UPI00237F13EC|nr:hypothetical protein [Phaeobacter gallaeciensis]MDE4099830.1 hypothetical protein [Phaeobacter gallaeciensis]MDE4108635.1 hypothetical protein [Phaeobacter gallaeciensis]MDE4113081.1 hypothetical protein [Phaeobacter gallaeciensis]MDE4117471.1 hypothetical protein [Phaeobacter gallaeciensis]MDE4122024.1 hypothetical protein [Phaeobacter gallaeciensis]